MTTIAYKLAAALRLAYDALGETRGFMQSTTATQLRAALAAYDAEQGAKSAWVMQVPVLSTKHLTEDTCGDWLSSAMEYHYRDVLNQTDGWFLRIGPADDAPEWISDAPDDLRYVINWFHEQGFDGWLRIDADGSTVDGLPTYHWD